MFCLESFQMIANGVSEFLSTSLQLTIARFTLFIKKKSCFVEDMLFYPKNEVIAFPKTEIKWVESAMFMFTLTLTRQFNFDNIVIVSSRNSIIDH